MCVLPLTRDLTGPVPVCCSLLCPWGPPILSQLVLSCVHAQTHASGTPSPGAAPRRYLEAHFPLEPTMARLSLHPTSSRAMGPPRLHTSHPSPFPPKLRRLQWERTPRGGISTFPPPAASPEGPRLGQVAGGRVSSGNFHSLLVGCRAFRGSPRPVCFGFLGRSQILRSFSRLVLLCFQPLKGITQVPFVVVNTLLLFSL